MRLTWSGCPSECRSPLRVWWTTWPPTLGCPKQDPLAVGRDRAVPYRHPQDPKARRGWHHWLCGSSKFSGGRRDVATAPTESGQRSTRRWRYPSFLLSSSQDPHVPLTRRLWDSPATSSPILFWWDKAFRQAAGWPGNGIWGPHRGLGWNPSLFGGPAWTWGEWAAPFWPAACGLLAAAELELVFKLKQNPEVIFDSLSFDPSFSC